MFLKSLFACCACETADLCPIDFVKMRHRARNGKIVSQNVAVLTSGSMIFPFFCDYTAISERFF